MPLLPYGVAQDGCPVAHSVLAEKADGVVKFMREPTNFELEQLESVIESFLYTDDGMFGDIKCDAERELYRRFPPPDWAKPHKLPILAEEWHGENK